MIIGDMETDDLWPEVSKIHCCVFYNIETGETISFVPSRWVKENLRPLSELPDFIRSIKKLSMHNGIGFDLKVWRELLGLEYKEEYFDTLLASRILWPDKTPHKYINEKGKEVSAKSAHGVENWGLEFNISKPAHEDWSEFSLEMLHRCTEDVRIQTRLYRHIIKYIEELKATDGRIDLEQTFRLEHKVWRIIEDQADYGWLFDLPLAFKLSQELSERISQLENTLIPLLPKRVVRPSEAVCKAFKANGEITTNATKWLGTTTQDNLMGDFSKVIFEDMNLGSDTQVKDYLLSKGWKPTEWNYKKDKHNKPIRDERGRHTKTSPKLPTKAEDWDNIAESMNIPEISILAERNKASHRLSQIKGLIDKVRPEDHRIEAQANTCSSNTARMVHRQIVNIPKAEEKVYYGREMRSLFIVPEDKVLVGCDASALEARMEAHYIWPFDRAAALELIEGDIHSVNAEVFQVERHVAKGGKYALTYGCAPAKLASTLGKPAAMANELYDRYWEANPGLKQLKEALETSYENKGYILAIDKRPLTIRYKHALINTLFQSAGSITMKVALCVLHKLLNDRYIPFNFLGNFHDEIQTETLPEFAEEVGKTALIALRKAGEILKLNVEITGEYKIGKTWADTH